MTSSRYRLLLATFATVLGMSAIAPAQASSLERTMKQMNMAYGAAIKSQSTAEMAQYVAKFKEQVLVASQMTFKGSTTEKETYQEGIQQLQGYLVALEQAIAQNDLNAAKEILKKIKSAEKHFHNALDV